MSKRVWTCVPGVGVRLWSDRGGPTHERASLPLSTSAKLGTSRTALSKSVSFLIQITTVKSFRLEGVHHLKTSKGSAFSFHVTQTSAP